MLIIKSTNIPSCCLLNFSNIGGGLLLGAFLSLLACTESGKEPNNNTTESSTGNTRPNIVLIVSDDHGMDDAGCYGNTKIKTPNLDALAAEGIRFSRAYCTTPSCSASRSVILTGLHNHANGQFGHEHVYNHFRTYDYLKSLPVYLEELANYRTARIGKFHVAPESVYSFQTVLQASGRNSSAMADSCLTFLQEESDQPFFLYFCTQDPHRHGEFKDTLSLSINTFGNPDDPEKMAGEQFFRPEDVDVPYYLPDNMATRLELAQYYQAVARMDRGFGRLFQHLKSTGAWDNTVVLYISDNGIAFPGAKTNIYEPGVRLPFIVKPAKGRMEAGVSDALVNWTDLTPTILDLAGILPEAKAEMADVYQKNVLDRNNYFVPGFQGRSLKNILEGNGTVAMQQITLSHTFHEITMYYPMRAIRENDIKLIWNVAHELPFPHAQDLWVSATWQSVLRGNEPTFAHRPTEAYTFRPEFELYNLKDDPWESHNLATDPDYRGLLAEMKQKLRAFQEETIDPWAIKWEHE
ncbi:MAG: sulfatase [Lewinella sp.]|nr:sulfatase [Lewinella sp.]